MINFFNFYKKHKGLYNFIESFIGGLLLACLITYLAPEHFTVYKFIMVIFIGAIGVYFGGLINEITNLNK